MLDVKKGHICRHELSLHGHEAGFRCFRWGGRTLLAATLRLDVEMMSTNHNMRPLCLPTVPIVTHSNSICAELTAGGITSTQRGRMCHIQPRRVCV